MWTELRRLLRNAELRRETIWHLGITAVFAGLAALWNPLAGLLLFALGLVLAVVHLAEADARYQEMQHLAEELDEILHGQRTSLITESVEGELAILMSQIRKLTIRLQEQSNRLQREKGTLARAMEDLFHQFRTPLTALQLEAALLREEDLPVARRQELVREVRRQLQRMEWLTEALLKMSRIDAGTVSFRRETVLVRELVQRAADPLEVSMELRGQTLELQIQQETLEVDPAWTAEALGNLLKNCMEHTPAGGHIWVSCEETALYTNIVIRDSGEGFAPEDLPNLFQRFYRGKNAGPESVGIGLSLARLIVSEQEGTLTAENAPEGGAQFEMRFLKSVV